MDRRPPGVKGLPPGFSPANSNTRLGDRVKPVVAASAIEQGRSAGNRGLTSERMRAAMIDRLREQGIDSDTVLGAMAVVPRHQFVDEALASRAYGPDALPIGHGQTISAPYTVARLCVEALNGRQRLGRVLEIGTGCGYQAAVLAQFSSQVLSIERIAALQSQAAARLRALGVSRVRSILGDGRLGQATPGGYDAIVVAAAGLALPQAWLEQLAVGGCLVAPEGDASQVLVRIERQSSDRWSRDVLDPVRFVPLREGVQR